MTVDLEKVSAQLGKELPDGWTCDVIRNRIDVAGPRSSGGPVWPGRCWLIMADLDTPGSFHEIGRRNRAGDCGLMILEIVTAIENWDGRNPITTRQQRGQVGLFG